MRWYYAIMKRILSGIIFFLFPLFVLVFIFQKAIDLVQKLILPIKKYLPPEEVLGIGILTFLSLIIILILCYLAGFLSERKRIKSLITKIEKNILVYVPGYTMLKSRVNNAFAESDDSIRAVVVNEGIDWRPGIEVDRNVNGYSTVFFPGPPSGKTGFLKLVHESNIKNLNISIRELMKMVRNYGFGSAYLMNDEKPLEEVKN